MQASGLVEVKSPVTEKPTKPKQGKGVNKETGQPHWMTCREKAIERLVTALRLVSKEFTTADLKVLSGCKGDAILYHATQLADLGLLVRVGKRGHLAVFKLNGDVDTFAAILREKGIRTSSIDPDERKVTRATQIREDMINFLKLVPTQFNTNDLRHAIGCYASVANSRIAIMLREGLIDPFEPEKWRGRYPRTYIKRKVMKC
jgi:hypothetical protein